MTNLLFRLFIKNHTDTADETVRRNYGILGGSVGIALNLVLFILKTVAGLLSASVAMIADALNNLSDAGASVIALVGFKMSGKPADKDHPFGHGRIEYISALLVAIVILLMGFELIQSSVGKIIEGGAAQFNLTSVVILCIAIVIKLWMFFFNRSIGKKIDSPASLATAKDSLSDAAATAVILLGALFSKATGIAIDGYLGALVSLFILYAGYTTIKDALTPLLGSPPQPEMVDEIEKTVLSHEGIIGIHDLIIHNYGPARFMISLHAEVPSNGDVLVLHDTIDLIEKKLQIKFNCDAVIHMDPVETDNEVINSAKAFITCIISEISADLSIHDFRMVTGPTHTNLIFDMVVPYNFKLSNDEIAALVQQKLLSYNETYFAVINFDNKYI